MMANGVEKARENVRAFEIWKATQTNDSFRQIIHRGSLSRGEIAKAINCGRSALNQNPELRKQLQQLEDELRSKGVLPLLTDAAKHSIDKPKIYDTTVRKKISDTGRASLLEKENIELKAQVKELKTQLERFNELSETLAEIGFVPR